VEFVDVSDEDARGLVAAGMPTWFVEHVGALSVDRQDALASTTETVRKLTRASHARSQISPMTTLMSSGLSPSPDGAELQGELWGARAEAWAEHEPQGTPIFDEVLHRAGVGAGTRLLDLGCGTGTLCRLATDRGARVAGLDASETLVAKARRRVPEGDFRHGDLQFLPYEDAAFDVVTGVNAFQFAADPVEALRAARRVVTFGGTVAVALWGRPERVDLFAAVRAVAALVPASPPLNRSLLEPGAVEEAIAEAGLNVRESGDGHSTFEFPDTTTMLRQMTAAGGMVRVARAVGEDVVRRTLLDVMERFQTPVGGYRLENEWHFVIAVA
jgi:SAM-dependent methyltransferase